MNMTGLDGRWNDGSNRQRAWVRENDSGTMIRSAVLADSQSHQLIMPDHAVYNYSAE